MKRLSTFILVSVCMFVMFACAQPKYKVTIADNYPIVNELKSSYAVGEEVTIQLPTLTEHYYEFFVNGVEQEMNRELSSWDAYTYFTFTMPEEDVLVTIKDVSVDIPEAPSPSPKPEEEYAVLPYLKGSVMRIWDRHYFEDSEGFSCFSANIPTLGGVMVEYLPENSEIYVGGEYLLGGPGNGCESFYLSDLTGDGVPELCFCMNTGSGIIDFGIVIFDYETRDCIFSLSDRMYHDYFLSERDGKLCVIEKDYLKTEVARMGILSYNGSELLVVWDTETEKKN